MVPKRGTDKFRLAINIGYVNRHLGQKAFKFEGLKDLPVLAERENHAVSYDLMSGYYHLVLHSRSRTFVGLKREGKYYVYICLLFGLSTAPWVFSKVIRGLVMYWRRVSLEDFMFVAKRLLAGKLEAEFARAGLGINVPKYHTLRFSHRTPKPGFFELIPYSPYT